MRARPLRGGSTKRKAAPVVELQILAASAYEHRIAEAFPGKPSYRHKGLFVAVVASKPFPIDGYEMTTEKREYVLEEFSKIPAGFSMFWNQEPNRKEAGNV